MRRLGRRVFARMLGAAFVGVILLGGVAITAPAAAIEAAPTAAIAAAPAAAISRSGVNDFTFASFTADYALTTDAEGLAQLTVTETFVANFPEFDQNRGIVRAIPRSYDNQHLNPAIVSVTNESGAQVPFETEVTGEALTVLVGDDTYLRGPHTFVLTYTLENVVRHFEDTNTDEFYVDTTGFDREQSIAAVSATLRVAPELLGDLNGESACYFGAEGSTDRCEISGDPQQGVFTASTPSILPARQNMSFAVGFTPNTFVVRQDPGFVLPLPPAWVFVLGGVASLGAIASVVALGITRRNRWGDAVGRGTIIPQYTVPTGINLLESSGLVGRGGDPVPAQLVSFAVRGKIRILDYAVTEAGSRAKHPFTLQLLNTDGLDDQELQLLDALFGGPPVPGIVVELIGTDEERAGRMSPIVSGIRRRLIARGMLALPATRLPLTLVVLSLALSLIASVCWFFLIGIPVIVVTLTMLARPYRLTPTGIEAKEYLLGMRVYLDLAEKDRFAMLQSVTGADRVHLTSEYDVVKLYEKLLPFAVMWGVEKSWAEALATHYGNAGTQPDWYTSNTGFNPYFFAASLNYFNATLRDSITPPVSTTSFSSGSFSGGAGGGGFSGGGFGGGGMGGR